MRVSTVVSALAALTLSLAVAAPAGLDRSAVRNAAGNALVARTYTPVPESLTTCVTAVEEVKVKLDLAVKVLAVVDVKAYLAVILKVILDLQAKIKLDLGAQLDVILGVATYEKGIVELYAKLILDVYFYLKLIIDSPLYVLVKLDADLVAKALLDLEVILKAVVGVHKPNVIADIVAKVAAELHVDVTVCFQLLAKVGLGNILHY